MPSTAVESMQLGGMAGMTALSLELGHGQTKNQTAEPNADSTINSMVP